MSIKKQTVSGLLWTFVDAFLLKGLSFIAIIVLARLLGPSDFGLFGMITVFISIGISLVDSGLSASLIRTKNSDDSDYSTVFYLNLLLSIILYIILFFASPFISLFYHQEILTNLIRLYCLSFVISAFSAVQLTLLNKQMQFQKMMFLNIPGTIIGVIVGVTLGYLNFGVWSIVWMYLAVQFFQALAFWLFSNWRPSFTFSKFKAKHHFKFGYKLMLSSLLDAVFNNLYNVLIGKFFSIQSLGYYERAKSFNDYPVNILTGIIGKVSYPLLAKLQDEKDKVASIYQQLLQFTFFVTAPLMLGLAAVGDPLFFLILGEKWIQAVPFFQILCISGMLYPIHAFNISVLKVFGRSDLYLKLEIIKKVIITITVVITFQFGIYPLLWSSVLISVIGLAINTYYSNPMINYNTKSQILDMFPVLLKSGSMSGIMFLIVFLLKGHSEYIQLITASVVGFSFYFLINFLFKAPQLFFAVNLFKRKSL
jgi:O-antigen/teichoic acid export membrane protein